ncbi:NAD-dependent epimerase dehydratase [Fusarium mundagurra]|uniref:NAD-dependent epimerase dehydratase n=1 Tax=Fusarium mundagurra TaxID=1567541 RepID=A0A8H6DRH1_9HYPO|nr:NAD-dependent epimerase dehydratase [Fusarium mundagurra]
MSRLPVKRILLTGATGYVGGTILDHLVKAQDEVLKGLTIDVLIRSDDAASKLRSAYGDRYEDLREPYPQRTTEVRVLTIAEETGVQAVSLNTPVIFGAGKGLFNQQGIIIPIIMRYVIQHGHGFKLNETTTWDWVHVEDLADVFVLLTRTILEREDRGVGYIPTGKNGILFPAVGRAFQTEIMQRCLDAAFDEDILPREDTPPSKEIRNVPLQELADEITAGLVDMAERGWAGTKSMRGTELKRMVGWNPIRLDNAWKQDFQDELEALKTGKRPWALESCIGKAG